MLPYVIMPVQPALQSFVESIFIMDIDFTKVTLPSVYKYPWSVTSHIYFTISGEPLRVKTNISNGFNEYPRNFVIGPRLLNDIVDLGQYRHVAGVTFRPGGLHRFLGIPVNEIPHELDLALLYPRESRQISEQLSKAKGSEEVLAAIESFLISGSKLLKPVLPYDLSLAELVRNNGNTPISNAAYEAGISMRQFGRRSLQSVGVSPKLFSRVTRFANAARYKEAIPGSKWVQIAYELGYSDQMHLIDDFKVFTGSSPKRLDQEIALKLFTGVEGRI